MFGKSFSLGRYLGIDLRVDYSWFIIFALIILSFSLNYLPAFYPELGRLERVSIAVVMALLFFGSVVLHEFAHSLYAKLHHIDINRITFFLFGGAAEIKDEPRTPKTEFIMAAVGPLTSYLIAIVFALVWVIGFHAQILYLEIAGSTLAAINTAVATFNLLPAYPLDGGRIFRAILWKLSNSVEKGTRYAAALGRILALALIAYGALVFLSGLIANGLWLMLLGSFLHFAAQHGFVIAMLRHKYGSMKTGDVMEEVFFLEAHPTQLQPDSPLMDAFEKMHESPVLYVGYDDKPVGVITRQRLRHILRNATRPGSAR